MEYFKAAPGDLWLASSKREKCICHARESTGKRESIKVQKHPPLWKSYNNDNNKVSV